MAESTGLTVHEDVPLFREAVNFTASKTGFNPRLIEKERYYRSILEEAEERGIPMAQLAVEKNVSPRHPLLVAERDPPPASPSPRPAGEAEEPPGRGDHRLRPGGVAGRARCVC